MNLRSSSASRSKVLKASIRAVELRMEDRRAIVKSTARRIANTIRERITAPAALITAGLFGAALHRGPPLQGSQLLPILHAANTGLRRLLTGRSRPSDTPN
jgi:hypothetical protein